MGTPGGVIAHLPHQDLKKPGRLKLDNLIKTSKDSSPLQIPSSPHFNSLHHPANALNHKAQQMALLILNEQKAIEREMNLDHSEKRTGSLPSLNTAGTDQDSLLDQT